MSLKIKIFSTSCGYIIGRVIEENKVSAQLKNPGLVQTIQDKKGLKVIITEFLPPIIKNKKKLMKNFLLSKNLVLFSDEVTPEFAEQYYGYEKQQAEKESGIQIVGKNALDKIKSNKLISGVFNGNR